jgi:hypothetical protein
VSREDVLEGRDLVVELPVHVFNLARPPFDVGLLTLLFETSRLSLGFALSRCVLAFETSLLT